MRGHPDLDGVHRVADEIIAGLPVDPALRLRLYRQIAQALLDEREACAKIVEERDDPYTPVDAFTLSELVKAIRAR